MKTSEQHGETETLWYHEDEQKFMDLVPDDVRDRFIGMVMASGGSLGEGWIHFAKCCVHAGLTDQEIKGKPYALAVMQEVVAAVRAKGVTP